jgi:hypothetical protein
MNAYASQAYTIPCVDSIQTAMATCLHLAPVGNKAVDLDFDGGLLSSDAGLMLLKDPDEQLGLTRALAAVLKDPRDPRRVHFTLHDLLKQRVLQIAAGYEDGEHADAGDYAAVGISSASMSMSGYQRLKMTLRSPLSVCTRVCNNRCAPALDHCIYCFLQNRLLTTSFTVDSTKLVVIASPWRYRSP